MTPPTSFAQAGFMPPSQARAKIQLRNGQFLKPLLIGTDGESDSGKTEFAQSVPGVIQMICLDRGYSSLEDNPEPPPTRNPNVFIKVIPIPSDLGPGLQASQYIPYFTQVCAAWAGSLRDPNSTVVIMDGHGDWWELHLLADFGKTTGIFPQTRYKQPYAEHRALINQAWDSGKIVICTNKVKDEYEDVIDTATGLPKKDDKGETIRRKTGGKVRRGFGDQEYLFNIQLRHMFKAAHTRQMGSRLIEVPKQWGVMITKCKHNPDLKGAELWGDECNFRGLVDLAYPDVPPERWGF